MNDALSEHFGKRMVIRDYQRPDRVRITKYAGYLDLCDLEERHSR
jgi:hypothetical protein